MVSNSYKSHFVVQSSVVPVMDHTVQDIRTDWTKKNLPSVKSIEWVDSDSCFQNVITSTWLVLTRSLPPLFNWSFFSFFFFQFWRKRWGDGLFMFRNWSVGPLSIFIITIFGPPCVRSSWHYANSQRGNRGSGFSLFN